MMVQVPLIVDERSGVNDYLDRDGSRTPVQFPCGLGLDKPIQGQVVQAATKWKRMALKQFDCKVGEGICTDMKAVRKDYFLDHDHSCYVDQWDWERVISDKDRNLDFLKDVVKKIWKVIWGAGMAAQEQFPALRTDKFPQIPEELTFIHAEEMLERYPDLPRKLRESKSLQEISPGLFIIGIGWVLEDGYPHEMRAADYDDWVTETTSADGRPMHGLNGDILVWNPVTQRRHELTSMGVRVTKDNAEGAAQDDRPGRLPEPAVSQGDSERRDSLEHRRRDRPVTNVHVPPAQGAPGRSQRHRLAGSSEGHVPQEEHPRARVGDLS